MFTINEIISVIYLLVLSVMDIRKRKLCLWFLLAGIPASVVCQIWTGSTPAVIIAAGGAVGIVFLAVSKVTEEAFGYGDSILIIALGILLGFWDVLALLTAAFCLAAVFAAVMMARKNFTRKSAFPFVPFLTAAYIGGVVLGRY